MATAFDLWHEDGLLFEDHPEWFVLLDRTPIVWTVRGLRLFRPRLALIGVDLRTIRTASEFEVVWSRWLDVEQQLLLNKIRKAASGPFATLEALCLQAVLDHDLERAEALVRMLEARPAN